jgi:hypothetical protein
MQRIAAPQHPEAARAAKLRAEVATAKARPATKVRTPAEVDRVLDLILEHLALGTDD